MKQLAMLAFLIAAAVGLQHGAAAAATGDPYCPPGAKYCPTPAQAPMADAGFGFGSYSAPTPGGDAAYFQSQLNEGEQLLMVAPGGDFANVPAPGTQPLPVAVPSPYAMPPPSPFATPAYAAAPVYAAPAPTPAYAAAPVVYSQDDGLRGFVPPPPGAASAPFSPQPVVAAPAYAAPAPAPRPYAAPVWAVAEPAPLTADAFYTPIPQPAAPAYAARPEARPAPAAPRDPYGAVVDLSARDEAAQRQKAAPAKKQRRADRLSEVANETSQRASKIDLKPRPENRLPWWKGGFWRKRGDQAEKKSRTEKREEKLAAARDRDDGDRAEN